jgi:hypothetical protein
MHNYKQFWINLVAGTAAAAIVLVAVLAPMDFATEHLVWWQVAIIVAECVGLVKIARIETLEGKVRIFTMVVAITFMTSWSAWVGHAGLLNVESGQQLADVLQLDAALIPGAFAFLAKAYGWALMAAFGLLNLAGNASIKSITLYAPNRATP